MNTHSQTKGGGTTAQTPPRAGTRYDRRTGQYVPTVDGKDVSPTSFDEARALQIAQECVTARHTPTPHPDAQMPRLIRSEHVTPWADRHGVYPADAARLAFEDAATSDYARDFWTAGLATSYESSRRRIARTQFLVEATIVRLQRGGRAAISDALDNLRAIQSEELK